MRWINIVLIVSVLFIGAAYAEEADQISSDPRLENAYKSYQQGVRNEERGDKAFRVRPGEAQRMYEYAEGYYLDAAFRYEQLSVKYNIDLKKEIEMCNKSQRSVHVKIGNARRKAKGR